MSNVIRRRTFIASALAATAVNSTLSKSMNAANFREHYADLMERFRSKHPEVVLDFRIVTITGNARPWIDAGMNVSNGDQLSIFATGQLHLSRTVPLSLLPRIALWTRIEGADAFRPGSDTSSFRANATGRFQLATLQGRWSTRQGAHAFPMAYDKIEGAYDVLLIRWATSDVEKGVNRLAEFASGDALIAEERNRLRAPLRLPRGFEELWYVGSGANFSEATFDGEPAIAARSELNGGIIKAPLDLPTTDGIEVEWDWRVNQLPSLRGEEALPFHQYVSIAIEFDDGQDLSWYWSAALETHKHYKCPLQSWPGETHLVVRSGASDHGRWVSERRNLQADIDLSLATKPRRIAGLWLIALTAFGQRPASVDFRRIAIVDAAGNRRRIFPA